MASPTPEDKSLKILTRKVNDTIDLSNILAGKKPVGGRLGKKLEKAKADETSVSKGKKARAAKFKEFDKYLDRMEYIANPDPAKRNIKITRALIQNPKNPDATI